MAGTSADAGCMARCAEGALDAAGVSVVRRWVAMEVPCTYAQFEGMRREVAAFSGVVEQVDYGADVVLSCLLPEERSAEFAAHVLDVTAGGVEVLEAGDSARELVIARRGEAPTQQSVLLIRKAILRERTAGTRGRIPTSLRSSE